MKMSQCPFCDYETPEPDPPKGDRRIQGWQEVAHMNLCHQDVIRERLAKAGIDMSVDFDEST